MKYPLWGDDALRELHRLRADGKTPAQIATATGRTEHAVIRRLALEKKRRGVVHRRLTHGNQKYSKEDVAAWRARLREPGMTQKKLARELEIPSTYMSVRLQHDLNGEVP